MNPTLIDRDGDRWEWGTDSTGRVGYRSVTGGGEGGSATTREEVERRWGPVKEETSSRVFQMPECPDDLLRLVAVGSGQVFTRLDAHALYWYDEHRSAFSWVDLLQDHPEGLREVVETEYEAAVRRLRETTVVVTDSGVMGADAGDYAAIRTILAEVVGGDYAS